VLHLIRDPRATGHSWLTKKYDPGIGSNMAVNSIWLNSMTWVTWNIAIEVLWGKSSMRNKYFQIHYSDFSRFPGRTLRAIADKLNISFQGVDLPHAGDTFSLHAPHTIPGNPVRLKSENLIIQYDDRWLHEMRLRDRLRVTLFTWPLMLHYGYPLTANIRQMDNPIQQESK
jgi:hypothetical protein